MVLKSLMLTRKGNRKPWDFIIGKIHFFDIIKVFEDCGLEFINIIVTFSIFNSPFLSTNQNFRMWHEFEN